MGLKCFEEPNEADAVKSHIFPLRTRMSRCSHESPKRLLWMKMFWSRVGFSCLSCYIRVDCFLVAVSSVFLIIYRSCCCFLGVAHDANLIQQLNLLEELNGRDFNIFGCLDAFGRSLQMCGTSKKEGLENNFIESTKDAEVKWRINWKIPESFEKVKLFDWRVFRCRWE